VEFARHDAGVFALAPDVADGAGVAPEEEAGFGVDGAIVGGVVGAVLEPTTGLGEEPIVAPPAQPATNTAAAQIRNEPQIKKMRIA
jgi:hypothetical protein